MKKGLDPRLDAAIRGQLASAGRLPVTELQAEMARIEDRLLRAFAAMLAVSRPGPIGTRPMLSDQEHAQLLLETGRKALNPDSGPIPEKTTSQEARGGHNSDRLDP